MGKDSASPRGLGDLLSEALSANLDVSKAFDDCHLLSEMEGDDGWESIRESMTDSSCAYFAQETLTSPIRPQFPDGRFVVAPHHDKWDEIAILHRLICILAARGHGKSEYWTYAYPVWKADSLPGGEGLIVSATQELASEKLTAIKDEIESNPKLRHLLPRKLGKRRWGSKAIKLANGHTIYARGYGTRTRGIHPDWIVVDDGLDDDNMYSETVREKDISFFISVIVPMLMSHTQLVVVGTPFHSDDLYARLKDTPEFAFFEFPALDEAGNPLWPELHSKAELEKIKRIIGVIAFTREYLCQPITDEMSLFPSYLFKGEPVEQPTVRLGMPRKFWAALGIETCAVGVDFALSASVQADYTVIWTMGMDRYGNRWIMDIRREHGMEYQHQLSLITEVARLYKPGVIFLESNQMQRIFGDELVRTTDLPIIPFETKANEKNSLDRGVPGLRILLENKKFRIPRGDEESVELTNRWRDEMKAFTWKDGKLQGVGSHDDLVMACWICDQALQYGGLQFGFEGDGVGDICKKCGGELVEFNDKMRCKKCNSVFEVMSYEEPEPEPEEDEDDVPW